MLSEKASHLSLRFMLGMKPDVSDAIHFIDDQTCCWPAGKCVVIYNMQTTQQRFIPPIEGSEGITCLQLTPNRRYLAIAESGLIPTISIVDTTNLKRKKLLSVPESGSKEYVSIAFSADGRFLLAQAGAPDWLLVYYNVEKGKSITPPFVASNADKINAEQDRKHITRCTINPRDPTHFCLSGNGTLKFVRYIEGAMRVVPGGMGKREPQMYLTHIWLPNDDRMIVSTDNGDLLLLENSEYKQPLPFSPSDALSIDAMVLTSKGFICGGDMGIVTVFEKTDTADLYRKVRTSKISGGLLSSTDIPNGSSTMIGLDSVKIKSFSLTHQEETLAITTSNQQIYLLNLSDFGKEEHSFEPLCQPFHSGSVTGVAICMRKPLLATCSKDRSVSVWNYTTHMREAHKVFTNEACSIALHPSGLHLLVGFTDRLRLLTLYGDEIREFKNFNVRSCLDCQFSNGGQYFAIANNSVIQLHLTYTCELLGNLRGHNNKVKSLHFMTPDDTQLLSVGVDGSIFQWDIPELRKGPDNSMKSICNNDVVSDGKSAWVVSTDRRLREFEVNSLTHGVEYECGDVVMNTIAYCSTFRTLFTGGADGSVRVLFLPLSLQNTPNIQSFDINCDPQHVHHGAVTRSCLTFDEGVYITVGEDGVISLFDIISIPGRAGTAMRKEIEFSPEILIHRKDLEEKNNTILLLQQRVKEMDVRMEEKQVEREKRHQEEVQVLTEKFKTESEAQYKKFESLLSIKNSHQEHFAETQRDMEQKHRQNLVKLRQDYQAQLRIAEETVQTLTKELEVLRRDYVDEAKRIREENEQKLRCLKDDFDEKLRSEQRKASELRTEEVRLREEFEIVRAQMEVDTDTEIDMLKELYDQKIATEKALLEDLKAENGFLKKKHQQLQTEIRDRDEDIQDKLKTKGILEAKITGLKKDIEALLNEITERTDTIGDKEKRIADLRKKNQELEKFRFVLEYKIRELRGQTEPKEEEIRVAGVKIAEMHRELDKYYHNNETLRLTIRDLKLKGDGQKSEIHNLSEKSKYAAAYKVQLREDLNLLQESSASVKNLKEVVKTLYHKHMKGETSLTSTVDEGDARKEYYRQRDYLEKTVQGLKKKLIKDSNSHRTDLQRIMSENVILIKEINELRKEKKMIVDSIARRDDTYLRQKEHSEELDAQRREIHTLRERIAELEHHLQAEGKSASVSGPAPL